MSEEDEDSSWFDPEDCDECECSASEFEESDWKNGAWHCPECGCTQ